MGPNFTRLLTIASLCMAGCVLDWSRKAPSDDQVDAGSKPDSSAIGVLDDPCVLEGELVCAGYASRTQLLCRDGKYVANGTCSSGSRCQTRRGEEQGTCKPIASGCEGKEPGDSFCGGDDTAVTCGEDLLDVSEMACGALASCIESTAAVCVCESGFERNGIGECVDKDECQSGAAQCGDLPCVNGQGTYRCGDCEPGYVGTDCLDIDECANGKPCGDGQAACTNSEGSYACECVSGYTGSGTTSCTSLALLADPDDVGIYTVSLTMTTLDSGIVVEARAPLRADGLRSPLILFVTGFQVPLANYSPFLERLASHGFVVIGSALSGGFDATDVQRLNDLQGVLGWATDETKPLGPSIDASAVMATGHSLGGKIAAMLAASDTRVTALLAIDPVNAGPFTADRPDVFAEAVPSLTIPVGFMGETVNATGDPACAPIGGNFQAFYTSASSVSSAVSWNFEGADTYDFVDDTASCSACAFCTQGTADPNKVLAGRNTLAVAFARLHLRGESNLQRWLTGPALPDGIVVESR